MPNRNNYIYFSLIVGVLVLFFIRDYITLIALSAVTVVVYNPLYHWFKKISGDNEKISLALTLISIFLSFVIPVLIVAGVAFTQAQVLVKDIQQAFTSQSVKEDNPIQDTDFIVTGIESINEVLENVEFVDLKLDPIEVKQNISDSIGAISSFLFSNLANVGSSALNLITIVFLYATLLAGIFPNQKRILEVIKNTSPFNNEINEVFIRRIIVMANAMVTGTLIIGLIQTIVSGFVLWGLSLIGVNIPYLFFILLLILFMSIIPVFGGGFITLPISAILILTGNYKAGLIVFLMQALVISNIDNILRPMLVPEEARLPASHILIGVFAGLTTFGVSGIIFGPIIMIIAQTTLDIYNKYFSFNIDLRDMKLATEIHSRGRFAGFGRHNKETKGVSKKMKSEITKNPKNSQKTKP